MTRRDDLRDRLDALEERHGVFSREDLFSPGPHEREALDPTHARDVLPPDEVDRLDAAERAIDEQGTQDENGDLTDAAKDYLDIMFGSVAEAELET